MVITHQFVKNKLILLLFKPKCRVYVISVDGDVQHILWRLPWPESVSKLYRVRDRRLSAKLVPTLWIEGATWSA
jgi:hypothetical protein